MEDTAMKMIAYEKPSMTTVILQHETSLLQTSGDPTKDVPLWDGEAGVKEQGMTGVTDYNVWDDDWSK